MVINVSGQISDDDKFFMTLALDLAKKGRGRVSPNPMVGCVIVRKGRVIAEGYHQRFGGPHAEVNALKKISGKAVGATMYVTLEPCYHFGKTPPCIDAVIKSGIKRVVIAMCDPNPLTAGKSIRKLKKAGIAVTLGVCEDEAKKLNRFFIKHITTGMPFVIAKVAQSLDGKIAGRRGERTPITGPEAFAYTQDLRACVDAVLVGKNTVLVDDPLLTVRTKKLMQPQRVILDGKLSLLRHFSHLQIFKNKNSDGPILLVSTLPEHHARIALARAQGVGVICCRSSKGRVDLKAMLKKLDHWGIVSILVEGGAEVLSDFARQKLVDEWHLLIAPCWLGSRAVPAFLSSPPRLKTKQIKMLGQDVLAVAGSV